MTTSRCLLGLDLQDHYATNRDDLIEDFYAPCLSQSSAYDRAVGYFRSSILLLTAQPVAAFAQRGGRMRLVCSPELSLEDIDAFEKGYEWRNTIEASLLRTLDEVLQNSLSRPLAEFVATLIWIGCLDVRIAFRPGARGVFHDKIGIFADDDGHKISFTGSTNETLSAWDPGGNHESFDVFQSWTGDEKRVSRHVEYFESLWEGQEPGIETIQFPEVAREKLVVVANTAGIDAAYERVLTSRKLTQRVLMPHQLAAVESWNRRGRRGILDHATGSGKTITAIAAIRDWLKSKRPVLVLVPSDLLLKQWYDEIRRETVDQNPRLLLAGGGHAAWREPDVVEGFTRAEGGPRITLATLQTAASYEFLDRVAQGQHLFIVIDEVHRAGSPTLSAVLSLNAGARLGLSATWQRYGDPAGTQQIADYFGAVLEPSFTLSDAIEAGRLCRYTYHVHPVRLTEEESSRWRVLTEDIRQRVARLPRASDGSIGLTDYIKLLLIKRADIIKTASAKEALAVEVLESKYEDGQRWLVYCDDQQQLGKVLSKLRAAGLPTQEYHSAMLGDRVATLDHYQTCGGILIAIKCLDEGVDIPAIDHALILASSRNPREFIQRRGRVLRVAPGKYMAEIHDALVLPPADAAEPEETSFVKGEIARAAQFALGAANDAVRFVLRRIAGEAGIDPEGVVAMAGIEVDEEEQK